MAKIKGVHLLTAASAVLLPTCGSAHMRAQTFLRRADNLLRRGPFAIFSSDLKHLQAEAEGAGDELHREHVGNATMGRPDYCPPNGKLLGPEELITGLHRIPDADLAQMDIKQAMHAILLRNYPCKGGAPSARR